MKNITFLTIGLLAICPLFAMKKNNEPLSKKAAYEFQCNYEGCDFATDHEKQLTTHKRDHMGGMPLSTPLNCSVPGCNYALGTPNRMQLWVHFKTHPTCTDCSEILLNNASLLKHVLQHQNANRLLQLQQNIHVQNAFAPETLLLSKRS